MVALTRRGFPGPDEGVAAIESKHMEARENFKDFIQTSWKMDNFNQIFQSLT